MYYSKSFYAKYFQLVDVFLLLRKFLGIIEGYSEDVNQIQFNPNDKKRSTKIEQHKPHANPGINSGLPEGLSVPFPFVLPVVFLLNDMNTI